MLRSALSVILNFARTRNLLALSAALMCACDRPPSPNSLREWTSEDHDKLAERPREGEPAGTQGQGGVDLQSRQLADLIWMRQCAQCHGPTGKGDGPSRAPGSADLSSKAWQSKITDAQIAASIRRMDAGGAHNFPDMPDLVVQTMVGRVRLLAGQ